MSKIPALCGAAFLCLAFTVVRAQSVDSTAGKLLNYPSRLFGKLQSKLTGLNNQLADQTTKYLQKMAKKEQRLQQKLMASDSVGAQKLFAGSSQQYAALIQKLKSDTGSKDQRLSGQYQPYVDSLQGELAFLKQNPQLLNGASGSLPAGVGSISGSALPSPALQAQIQGPMSQFQAMQAKLQDANQAQTFIQQRRMAISAYVAQHSSLQNLTAKYTAGLNADAYYYSQQVQQYRAMLNDPGKLEMQALSMVRRLSAYQLFMKSNSQLSGLFKLPGGEGPGTAQAIPGLQAHSQIAQQVQSQAVAGGGGSGPDMGSVTSKVQAAQSQLDAYKSRISQLGAGSTTASAPDFRPNDQKTIHSLWRRLEYGVNFQTTRNSYYYPTTTDFGASLGYRLGHSNVVGIGLAWKMGWGPDINHISITGQGVGLRSFAQVAIKNGFSTLAGYEYVYSTPYRSLQQLRQLQYWSRVGLLGIGKTISTKSKIFKKAQLQLLWDFLSYQQQAPQGQPLVFRIGYTF